VAAAGLLGVAIIALGGVYLTVECQALPGVLGGTPGDTSPRTWLGVACLALGAAVLGLVLLALRRHPEPPGRS
jgi:hypothetical protein